MRYTYIFIHSFIQKTPYPDTLVYTAVPPSQGLQWIQQAKGGLAFLPHHTTPTLFKYNQNDLPST